jgi:SAM-dependent methyltransferase
MHAHGAAAEERLANDPTSELWGEHRSRYRFAIEREDVRGKRVLDLACGAGFGLEMLRRAGARVSGADRDPVAVAEARRASAGAEVLLSDAAGLPFPGGTFDVVTSFETLEHVPDAAAMVREIARVLRPDGVLVLSTPNRCFGPPELHTNNPFHVREFSGDELGDLLRERFANVRLHGQWPVPGYRFVPYLLVEGTGVAPAALAWKIQNRLPYALKNRLARALSGRPFYPGEEDYAFPERIWEGAHALVAIARGPHP